LVDGPIPIDKIRVHLVDDIVYALRDMPEHKALITNWAAMLRAIGDDNVATTTSGRKAADRAEVAKQRVLVRMLACAAQAEVVAVAEPGFLSRNVDPEAQLEEEGSAAPTKTKKGASKSSGGMPHEVLSVALLSSLPDLLVKFKGDHTILESLTNLPTYICEYTIGIA
jgi:cell envelope opacity-associated protein A